MIENLLLSLALTVPVAAQDDAEAAPGPTDTLKAALAALSNDDDGFLMRATVEEIAKDSGFGMGTRVIVGGPGGGGGGETFEGELDIWRTRNREWVITTPESLPGLAIFDDGDRLISRSTFEDQAYDVGRLHNDLLALLDLENVAKKLDRVSFEVETSESGETTLIGELPKRLIRSSGGAMAMMAPTVLRIEAKFVLDANQQLASAVFGVVRNDPMAAIRRQAMEGSSNGEVRMRFSPDDMPEESKEEGNTSMYEIRVLGDGRATVRANAFLEDVEAMLSTEEV